MSFIGRYQAESPNWCLDTISLQCQPPLERWSQPLRNFPSALVSVPHGPSPSLSKKWDNLHYKSTCFSPQGKDCIEQFLSFTVNFLAPLSFYKNIPLCITHQCCPLHDRWVAAPLMNCLLKPIRSLHLLHWIFPFNNTKSIYQSIWPTGPVSLENPD